MSARKNWYAAALCGASVIAVALIPHNKFEFKDAVSAAASNDSFETNVDVSSVAKTSIANNDSLSEVQHLRKNIVIDQFLNSMRTDAFGDRAIFGTLSTFEPVMNIMKKGIVSFDRKTLRTPQYREEQGYDLLVYQIHHPLSMESKIMAYIERRAGELPIFRIVFLTGRPGVTNGELVQFENGALVSHREVAWADAQTLFDHQLSDASTLMSASIR
jgi:hypothetical protein